MVIGGGHCSDTGATAFNGSYVGTVRSSAFGQELPSHKRESSRSTFEVRGGLRLAARRPLDCGVRRHLDW